MTPYNAYICVFDQNFLAKSSNLQIKVKLWKTNVEIAPILCNFTPNDPPFRIYHPSNGPLFCKKIQAPLALIWCVAGSLSGSHPTSSYTPGPTHPFLLVNHHNFIHILFFIAYVCKILKIMHVIICHFQYFCTAHHTPVTHRQEETAGTHSKGDRPRISILTGGNWQKWKRVFLTCPCHKIYRDEAVGLKSCKNTWKITIFVKMWNLGQYRGNLIFCQ